MNEKPIKFAQSDDLIWLRGLIDKILPNRNAHQFVKFQIIIDANIIIQDIKYLLTKVDSTEVRTGFLEILEAQAIDCYAPSYLAEEIDRKIPEIAGKYNFSAEKGFLFWKRFSKHIKFINCGGPGDAPPDARDPKDWPYIVLQKKLEHPILTKDKDIAGMGAKTVSFAIVASLRTYARESANSMSIFVAGGAAVAIPAVVIGKAISFIHSWLCENMPTPPRWFWILSVVLVGVLLVYPPSRNWLKQRVATLSSSCKDEFTSMITELKPVIVSFENSRDSANKALNEAYGQVDG